MASSEGPEDFGVELAEDSLPATVSTDAVPIRLNHLFPWHRPRKQKVRRDQWVGLANTLVRKLKQQNVLAPKQMTLPDGSSFQQAPEIRYLTLPGLDYLDVRLIGEMCGDNDCKLESVGFLSDAEDSAMMARARVRETSLIQAGYIMDTSLTLPRSIESICNTTSGTLNELKRRAPFHIINIDACGSIAPTRATHSRRLIDAIFRLVELQLGKANHRWLLFVTVDARDDNLDADTFEALCNAVRENAKANADFELGAIAFLNGEATELEGAIESSKTDGRPFLNMFSLGFAKWLLHLAEVKQWSIKLKRSHCYSTRPTEDASPSMVSLAFEFLPPPVGLVDPHSVSRQKPSPGGSTNNPSMQILEGASQIDDLDALLEADAELSVELNAATHSLLIEAGYEIDTLSPLVAEAVAGQATPPHRFPDLLQAKGA
ncbi:hypothetical protein E2A64_03015 [Pseudohoeflea suaedae]|uniref:Uncharacterized protein n=1 Tax=Pseudohoeflea suaedae TaxID=877384 RepID=A0A4R5PM92_9HYPH|nr:hypothetical protein [Pseudohoeflea suaedae]TDH38114.1 hypothetical protein E2A64_03015 [Pseudohoeflea suaedae]